MCIDAILTGRRFRALVRVDAGDTDDELNVEIRDEPVLRSIDPIPDHIVANNVDVRDPIVGDQLHQGGRHHVLRSVQPYVEPVSARIAPTQALG